MLKNIIIASALFLAFVIGMNVGVAIYKHNCEIIGWSAGDKWRECAL
jgi:hypothetical protein